MVRPPLARLHARLCLTAGSLLARRRGLPSDHRTLTKYNRPLPLCRCAHSCCPGSWICCSSTAPRTSTSSPPISCSSCSTSSEGDAALRKPCECLTRLGPGSSLGRVDPPRIQWIQGGQVLLLHGLVLSRRALFLAFFSTRVAPVRHPVRLSAPRSRRCRRAPSGIAWRGWTLRI